MSQIWGLKLSRKVQNAAFLLCKSLGCVYAAEILFAYLCIRWYLPLNISIVLLGKGLVFVLGVGHQDLASNKK